MRWITADIHLADGRKTSVQVYSRTPDQVAEDLARIVGKLIPDASVRLLLHGDTFSLTGVGQVENWAGDRLGTIRLSRSAQAPIEQLRAS